MCGLISQATWLIGGICNPSVLLLFFGQDVTPEPYVSDLVGPTDLQDNQTGRGETLWWKTIARTSRHWACVNWFDSSIHERKKWIHKEHLHWIQHWMKAWTPKSSFGGNGEQLGELSIYVSWINCELLLLISLVAPELAVSKPTSLLGYHGQHVET